MNNLNSLIIEGNIKEIKVSDLPNGLKVTEFSVAVLRYQKKEDGSFSEEVSCFSVLLFGRMAELAETNGKIGRGIRIVGRLKQERFIDSDGKAQSKIIVIAEHVEYKPILNSSGQTQA